MNKNMIQRLAGAFTLVATLAGGSVQAGPLRTTPVDPFTPDMAIVDLVPYSQNPACLDPASKRFKRNENLKDALYETNGDYLTPNDRGRHALLFYCDLVKHMQDEMVFRPTRPAPPSVRRKQPAPQ